MNGLRRSDTDKYIAGVCGGLGAHFNIDPNLIRIGFALATIFAGVGVGVYLVLWLILPSERSDAPLGRAVRRDDAVGIAEERYARGEISADEFERIRTDLRGGRRQ